MPQLAMLISTFFFLTALIAPLRSKNVYVDVSLSTSSGSTYPTLQEALEALINTSGTLLEVSNTVTLLPSCASQTLPISGLTIKGASATRGVVNITYPSLTETLSDFKNCSQLPIVSLTTSPLTFSTLTTVAFYGVTLQFSSANNINKFSTIYTVDFTNICFNNTEPTLGPDEKLTTSTGSVYAIQMFTITTIVMSNIIYAFDGFKTVYLSAPGEVNITNITFFIPASTRDLKNQAIIGGSATLAASVITARGINVICEDGDLYMPNIIYSLNMTSLDISSLKISNCNFNQPNSASKSFIYATYTLSVSIQDVLLDNVTLGTEISGGTGYEHYITTLTNPQNGNNAMNITLANWVVQNSNINYKSSVVYVNNLNSALLTGLQMQNMILTNSTLYWYAYFINTFIYAYPGNTLSQSVMQIPFDQIQITQSKVLANSKAVGVSVTTVSQWGSIEIFQILLSSMVVQDNIVESSTVIGADVIFFLVTNLQAKNNTIRDFGDFMQSSSKISTLLMLDSTFEDFTISQDSALISYNFTSNSFTQISCESYNAAGKYIYAQTRPFLISNCIFSNITLNDQSIGIVSTNPQIVFHNNVMRGIQTTDSQVLQFGSYINFVNDKTICTTYTAVSQTAAGSFLLTLSQTSLPTISSFYPFLAAESIVFQNSDAAGSAYYAARNASWAFDSVNSVIILSVMGNTFDDITTSGLKNLFALNNHGVPNSSVSVINNTISNVRSTEESSIFESKNALRIYWDANKVSSCTMSGYLLEVSGDYLNNLVIGSDSISQVNGLTGYQIDSLTCDNVNITGVSTQAAIIGKAFLSISCLLLTDGITMDSSKFENLTVQSSIGMIAPINFIVIKTKRPPQEGTIGNIVIQNSFFTNISLLQKEGYVTKLYDNSLFQISGSKAEVEINNCAFDSLTAAPSGNMFMISIPSISITNSSFSRLVYYDVKGAFNLVFEKLSVIQTNFVENKGKGANGAGLMRFTNPRSSPLDVTIQECSYVNNTAPYGTIAYAETTKIQLLFSQNNVSGNTFAQWDWEGGLLYFYNISASSLTVENSQFSASYPHDPSIGNLGGSAFAIEKSQEAVTLQVSNCSLLVDESVLGDFLRFHENENVVLTVSQLIYGYNEVFSSSSPSSPFGIMRADKIQASFDELSLTTAINLQENSLFTLNFSSSDDSPKELQITNSIFESLSTDEGIITIASYDDSELAATTQSPSVKFSNCSFSKVSLFSSSSSVPTLPSSTYSAIGTGIVRSLTPYIGYSDDSSDNYAIIISDCTFSEIIANQGGVIFTGLESLYDRVLLLEDFILQSISTTAADNGGGLIKFVLNPSASYQMSQAAESTSSEMFTVSVNRGLVKDISAVNGGILSWESETKPIRAILQSSNFTDLEASSNGGLIFASYFPSSFTEQAIFNISNCKFTSMTANNGGIFHLEGATEHYKLHLTSNSYENISVSNNGAIFHLEAESTSTESSRRRVLNGSADSKRRLQTTTGDLTITSNQFVNIFALNGGILFENTPSNSLVINLDSSQFNNIIAQSRGGIFYLNQPLLVVTNNNFSQSYASIAGSIVYSSSPAGVALNGYSTNYISYDATAANAAVSYLAFAPTNLKIEIFDAETDSPITLQNYESLSNTPTLTNVTSYSLRSMYMRFTLINAGTDEVQVVADVSPKPFLTISLTRANGENPLLYSSSECANSVCTFDSSGVTLFGQADEIITVTVTYRSQIYFQSQIFYIKLRPCLSGEANNTATEQCIYCATGTYSLLPNDTACRNCPDGADCLGGTNVTIFEGFYRSNISHQLLVVDCNDTERCKGGQNNSCHEMYKGPVCLQCNMDEGVLTAEDGKCSKCYSKPALIAVGTIIIVGSVLYQLGMVVATFNEGKKLHNRYKKVNMSDAKTNEFMMIFTTFTQITSLFSSYSVGVLDDVSGVFGTIANASTQLLVTLKCLVFIVEPDPLTSMKIQMLFVVFSPIAKILIVALFELLMNLFRKAVPGEDKKMKSIVRIGTVAVVLIVLEQPSIIGFLGDYLACDQLDPNLEDEFIINENNIQCYTPRYTYFRNILVIPALLFWGFVVPLAIFLILRLKRKQLFESQNYRIMLGNFYSGYSQKGYYWGLLVFVLKMAMFIVNSVLPRSPVIKILIFICTFHLYYKLMKRVNPYDSSALLRCERLTVLSYILVLVMLLFQAKVEVSWIQEGLSILTLFPILFTEGYILLHVFHLQLKKFLKKVRKFRAYFTDKKILEETMNQLRSYHEDQPRRVDENKRRNAISLDLPDR